MTSILVYTSKIYEMIIVFPLRFLVNLFIWFHLLSLCFRWPSVLNWTYQPRLFGWYLVQKSWCHLNLRVIVTFCTLYAPAWNISFRVLVSSQALSNIPIRDSNVILFSWCIHNITEFFQIIHYFISLLFIKSPPLKWCWFEHLYSFVGERVIITIKYWDLLGSCNLSVLSCCYCSCLDQSYPLANIIFLKHLLTKSCHWTFLLYQYQLAII